MNAAGTSPNGDEAGADLLEVAHDLNNLLAVVVTYADLLLQPGRLDDDARADVAKIAEAARRAADLGYALRGDLRAIVRRGDATVTPAPDPVIAGAAVDVATADVLVVEDDPALRIALCDMLASCDHQVAAASSAEEALALLGSRHEPPPVVVTDLVMPGMGGLQLHRSASQRWPGIRTVMLSGHPLAPGEEQLLDDGIVAWLQKPVSLGDLAATVARADAERPR